MVTTSGKPITHAQLILNLLDAVLLPEKLAIVNVRPTLEGQIVSVTTTEKQMRKRKRQVLNRSRRHSSS